MPLIIPDEGLRLVGIGSDGRPTETILVAMPATVPWPAGTAGRFLAVADITAADPATIVGAVASGAVGLLVPMTDGWSQIERIAARLAVAEAGAGLPDGVLTVAAVCTTPRAVLSLTRPPADEAVRRLVALGLHGRLARAAAGTTARGLVQLAAADLGVLAFEHHPAATNVADLAGSRAAGFTAALVPIGR
jgi:hypothetical protein